MILEPRDSGIKRDPKANEMAVAFASFSDAVFFGSGS